LNGKHVAEEKYPRHAKAVREDRDEWALAVGAGVTAVIVASLAVLGVGVALSQGILPVTVIS
jgi:hypothetical protein